MDAAAVLLPNAASLMKNEHKEAPADDASPLEPL